jgi:hypothetical protein
VTPDQAWKYGEAYDYFSAFICEMVVASFLLAGTIVGLYNFRVRYRFGRRAFRKWRKTSGKGD